MHVDFICYRDAKKERVCNTKNVCRCNFQMQDCEAMNAWNKIEKEKNSARQGYMPQVIGSTS